MGHVLLVTGWPRRVTRDSFEGIELGNVWPAGAQRVWKLPTIESTRAYSGLHKSEMLFRVDPNTGALILFGELIEKTRQLCRVDNESVEVWQSPSQLRMRPRLDLMTDVLNEMVAQETNWSLKTAVRAVFKSSLVDPTGQDGEILLEELRECWDVAPICTSVVIIFWQRYLEKLALAEGQGEGDFVLSWMPLKADRALPGNLIRFLEESGWNSITSV